jgi:phage FluMu protein Com
MRIKCPQCKNVIKLAFTPERVTSTSEAEPRAPSQGGVLRIT